MYKLYNVKGRYQNGESCQKLYKDQSIERVAALARYDGIKTNVKKIDLLIDLEAFERRVIKETEPVSMDEVEEFKLKKKYCFVLKEERAKYPHHEVEVVWNQPNIEYRISLKGYGEFPLERFTHVYMTRTTIFKYLISPKDEYFNRELIGVYLMFLTLQDGKLLPLAERILNAGVIEPKAFDVNLSYNYFLNHKIPMEKDFLYAAEAIKYVACMPKAGQLEYTPSLVRFLLFTTRSWLFYMEDYVLDYFV